MVDQKFFKNSGKLTCEEICNLANADCQSDVCDSVFTDVAPLSKATSSDISFLDNVKYKQDLIDTKAGACFVKEEFIDLVPETTIALVSQSPYRSYALTAHAFYPEPSFDGKVEKTAVVPETAKIGKGCFIGHYVVIGDDAVIGDNAIIESNTVIGDAVIIGDNCRIQSNVTLSHCEIGENTRIYPGCRIGQDGFGFAMDPTGFVKVPQLGRVIIGKNCEIGANTCIDRGAGPDTVIGSGSWIDNLVQVGHNVKTGSNCVVVSQTGIAGSSELGDFVVLGGQAGIAGHLKIGSGTQVAAKSGVMNDLTGGETYMGSPAMPRRQFLKQTAWLRKMSKKN